MGWDWGVTSAKVLPLRGDGTSSRRHGSTRFPTSAANVKGVTANVKGVTANVEGVTANVKGVDDLDGFPEDQ